MRRLNLVTCNPISASHPDSQKGRPLRLVSPHFRPFLQGAIQMFLVLGIKDSILWYSEAKETEHFRESTRPLILWFYSNSWTAAWILLKLKKTRKEKQICTFRFEPTMWIFNHKGKCVFWFGLIFFKKQPNSGCQQFCAVTVTLRPRGWAPKRRREGWEGIWPEPSPALQSALALFSSCCYTKAEERRMFGFTGRWPLSASLQLWLHFPEGGGGRAGRVSCPGLPPATEPQRIQIPPKAARPPLYPAENWRSHLGRVSLKMTELPKVNRENNHNRNSLHNVSL